MSSVQGPMRIDDENEALLDDIIEILESPDGDKKQVILLIGRSGAGKSAQINTVHKVLTGKYFVIAKDGRGISPTVSVDLRPYDSCGVQEHRIADEYRRRKLSGILKKLPLFLDFAGLGDENTLNLREILELLIGGYIPPGTNMPALEKLQTDYGEGGLKKVFNKSNPARKVTKLVFVQGCIDIIPKNLTECVRDVLNIIDADCLTRKYHCDVYVVITKYDLVKDSSDINLHGTSGDRSIQLNELEKLESDIAKELNFEGAIESNRIRWVSFTDNIGHDNPHVDNIALKFLKKMVEPGVPEIEKSRPLIDFWIRLQLTILVISNQMRRILRHDIQISFPMILIIVAVMVAIVAFLYSLLKQTA